MDEQKRFDMKIAARFGTILSITLNFILFSCQKPSRPSDQIVNNSSKSTRVPSEASAPKENELKTIPTENACSQDNDPGPNQLLRLTHEQYKNSVREIFGGIPQLDQVLPNPNRKEIGSSLGPVSLLDISQYAEASKVIADAVVAKIEDYAPCETQNNSYQTEEDSRHSVRC